MRNIIRSVKNRIASVKENLLIVGTGITAIGLLFVIASVFSEVLGMYVFILVSALIFTEIKSFIVGNKRGEN